MTTDASTKHSAIVLKFVFDITLCRFLAEDGLLLCPGFYYARQQSVKFNQGTLMSIGDRGSTYNYTQQANYSLN